MRSSWARRPELAGTATPGLCFNQPVSDRFTVRPANEDDPPAIAAVFERVRGLYPPDFVREMNEAAADVSRLMQTGHAFLVAEREEASAARPDGKTDSFLQDHRPEVDRLIDIAKVNAVAEDEDVKRREDRERRQRHVIGGIRNPGRDRRA